MKEKLKMVQVKEETHYRLKVESAKKQMSIKEYVEYLLNREAKNEF